MAQGATKAGVGPTSVEETSEFGEDLLPLRQDVHNSPDAFHEWLDTLLNQGTVMLVVLRNHVHQHAPHYTQELEHAIMCYNMIKLQLDDYFATMRYYSCKNLGQRELKWWPDLLFRWVAAVIFAVLDKVKIQTLDYYVNRDNLKQVFRHLQWGNILFNWKNIQ